MENIFALTSGKGGVGKSTVALGLATAFSALNKTVLLIDMDQGLRCLDLMLGISEKVAFDISDVLDGRDAESAIYGTAQDPRIFLMPAPMQIGSIKGVTFGEFIREAALNFDVVIIDFPAGIDFSLYSFLPDQTHFITVCTPDPVSLRDASLAGDKLYSMGKQNVRLIINKFDISYIKNKVYPNIDSIIDIAGLRLIGIIPSDINLTVNQAASKLTKKGRAYKAFLRLAKRLNGQDVKLPKPKKI